MNLIVSRSMPVTGALAIRTQQIGKEFPVTVAFEEAGQFAAQTVNEVLGKLVLSIFETMQDERAEQDFSAGIVGALLFVEPGLQRRSLRVQFGQTLLD